MDYAGAVIGILIAAACLAWGSLAIDEVMLMSALPGLAVLALLALLPVPGAEGLAGRGPAAQSPAVHQPLRWHASPAGLRALLTMVTLFSLARASEAFIVLRGHELGLSVVELLLLWAWLAPRQDQTARCGPDPRHRPNTASSIDRRACWPWRPPAGRRHVGASGDAAVEAV